MADGTQIMLVEDSPTQVEELKYILEKNGYEIVVACNGVEALVQIHKGKPAIVISDVIMPEMDGYTLCKEIKADPNLKDIPVILLTWLSDPTDVIKGLDCGADNFIIKPYNENSILSRIRHILINKEIRRSGNFELGLEVFFAGQRYSLNSERIQIIDLLLATYENSIQQKQELEESYKQLQKAHKTIVALEESYRTLLERNVDAMVVLDENMKVCFVNPAAETLLGKTSKTLMGEAFAYPVAVGETREIDLGTNDGRQVAEMRVAEVTWQGANAYLISLRDVTQNVQFREKLQNWSITDELTGLYNRRGFLTLGQKQLDMIEQLNGELFLFYIDVDNMKWINDTFGHHQGDLVLQDAASILKNTFRESDIVGRLGGDEFAALAIGARQTSFEVVMSRLKTNIDVLNAKAEHPYSLAMSVGVVYYDYEQPCSIEKLLADADREMYKNKKRKNNPGC